MKTAGAIRVPFRRRSSMVPILVVAGVVLVAAGAAEVVRGPAPTPGVGGEVSIERLGATTDRWGFVLRADRAQVLRHRPGLEPVDFLRTHAFGWDGVTMREVFGSPELVKELRLQADLTPIDLIRLEARGN